MKELLHLLREAMPEIIGGLVVAVILSAAGLLYTEFGLVTVVFFALGASILLLGGWSVLSRRKRLEFTASHVSPETLRQVDAPTSTSTSIPEETEESKIRSQQSSADKAIVKAKFLNEVVEACQVSLTELLALQYPWGEWSDRRTTLESIIAEREPFRGPEGPKPNVARTLFALQVLNQFQTPFIERRKQLALAWMTQDVSEGWYWEWTSTQSLDSESPLPNLVKRRDVRHTAQVVSTLCRWGEEREPLASLLASIAHFCFLGNGFCPDTPGESTPRLLASVYAIEALGYATSGRFRLDLEDLIDRRTVIDARSSLRQGLNALHRECDLGDGLLGYTFSGPTPYLTGIALFRLAPLSPIHQGFHELTEKMVSGLIATAESTGWFDHSVPLPIRPNTRKRTTLRVAAGLGLASRVGVSVPDHLKSLVAGLAHDFIFDEDETDLDWVCLPNCESTRPKAMNCNG